MKKTSLVGIVAGLLVSGSLLVSPAFANQESKENIKQTVEQALSQMPLPGEGYENITLRPPYITKEEEKSEDYILMGRAVGLFNLDADLSDRKPSFFVYPGIPIEKMFRDNSFNVALYPSIKPNMQK